MKEEINFLIFNRVGVPELEPEHYPNYYVLMKYDEAVEMSSSEIRNKLKWNNPIHHAKYTKGLLHDSNIEYI